MAFFQFIASVSEYLNISICLFAIPNSNDNDDNENNDGGIALGLRQSCQTKLLTTAKFLNWPNLLFFSTPTFGETLHFC